ncbi:hypothetical protein ACVI1J_005946 [Bradyrhizobium diazoefficiens]
MQTALVIALSLHVLSSVFWAGSSFALARTGAAGGEQLVGPQLGAAMIAILTGGYLGHSFIPAVLARPSKCSRLVRFAR